MTLMLSIVGISDIGPKSEITPSLSNKKAFFIEGSDVIIDEDKYEVLLSLI